MIEGLQPRPAFGASVVTVSRDQKTRRARGCSRASHSASSSRACG